MSVIISARNSEPAPSRQTHWTFLHRRERRSELLRRSLTPASLDLDKNEEFRKLAPELIKKTRLEKLALHYLGAIKLRMILEYL